MTSFPYGLMAVGAVADEINLNIGKTISRIERQANNSSNMAAAEASGRDFVFDTNYIYIVRETPIESSISIDGMFTACDHGLEIIDGTSVPVHVQTLYGQNLVDKLRTDVVTISEQELTDEQKAQVRENIGAGTGIIAISVSSSSSTSTSVSVPGLTANHRLILETPVFSIADITLTPGNDTLTVACSAGIPAMKLAAYLPA